MALFSEMMDEACELRNEIARLREALQAMLDLRGAVIPGCDCECCKIVNAARAALAPLKTR